MMIDNQPKELNIMTDTKARNRVQEATSLLDDMTMDEIDKTVDYIRAIYKARRAQENARKAASLKPGSKVRFCNRNSKPGYLFGMTGTIEEFRTTRVVVKLDAGPVGKFRSGRVITHPASLELI